MHLNWTKLQRFGALMNGVFIGVGIIFLIWGATDIAFPIAERMNVAVFGLMRIILGVVSLSVGIGVEAVQWAKIGEEIQETSQYESVHPPSLETAQNQSQNLCKPSSTTSEQSSNKEEPQPEPQPQPVT